MHHCMDFMPSDVWYLYPDKNFVKRKINIGFCPICGKPVVEFKQYSKNGTVHFLKETGFKADKLCLELSNQVDFKKSKLVSAQARKKLYGWIYGINKENTLTGTVEQFASDFYGNKQLIKEYKD